MVLEFRLCEYAMCILKLSRRLEQKIPVGLASCLAEKLIGSQEGLCSMQLFMAEIRKVNKNFPL
jgi:hypothetical protein